MLNRERGARHAKTTCVALNPARRTLQNPVRNTARGQVATDAECRGDPFNVDELRQEIFSRKKRAYLGWFSYSLTKSLNVTGKLTSSAASNGSKPNVSSRRITTSAKLRE